MPNAEKKSAPREVVRLNPLENINDVIKELLLIKGKHLSTDEANRIFREIGSAITTFKDEEDFEDFGIKLFIEGEPKYVTLQVVRKEPVLMITKDGHVHHG